MNRSNPLTGFYPRVAYPAYEGMTPVTFEVEVEQVHAMLNLIVDMVIRGAESRELIRAIRHSMVVLDSQKHNLDYKQSAVDNDIAQLKAIYQKHLNH